MGRYDLNKVLVVLEFWLLMPSPEVPGEVPGVLDELPRGAEGGESKIMFPTGVWSLCHDLKHPKEKHRKKQPKEHLVAVLHQNCLHQMSQDILREPVLTCDFGKGMKNSDIRLSQRRNQTETHLQELITSALGRVFYFLFSSWHPQQSLDRSRMSRQGNSSSGKAACCRLGCWEGTPCRTQLLPCSCAMTVLLLV